MCNVTNVLGSSKSVSFEISNSDNLIYLQLLNIIALITFLFKQRNYGNIFDN